MSLFYNSLVGNTTVPIMNLNKPRALTQWNGTFYAKGTFGGGTISWSVAVRGDTATLLPLTDYSGAAITSTANDIFNTNFGNGNSNSDCPRFYATMAGGSTLASVEVGVYDNQG